MLDDVLVRGRRRLLASALFADLATAGCVLFGGFALLLVLGTRIFDWWIPVLLGLAAFGLTRILAARRRPADLNVAHLLDTNLALSDTLATAVHFRDSRLPSAVAQRRQAEKTAESIDLARSLPYRRPRSLPVLAGLVATSLILFGVRYGVTHSVALRTPIVAMNLDPFAPETRASAQPQDRKNRALAIPPGSVMNRLGNSTPDNPNADDLQGNAASAVTSSSQESKTANGEPAGAPKDGSAGQSTEASNANAAAAKEGGDQSPSSRDGEQQGPQAANKSAAPSAGSGLLSKLKDAVSSLMAKMKPQGGQSPQNANQQEAKQASGKQQQGQPSGQKQGQQGDKGNPSQQEGDESAASDSDQSAPGQGKGKSSDQNAAAKPGSGMGHQDGSKELKDAEQLEAMGKLSEIIGKRSANITGEMTIESQSGPQQLKTGYTHSAAKHGESGGDVSRDEVPVALQGYVQNYFEQVRASTAHEKPANPSVTR